MSLPKVSVIVTVFNSSQTIGRCVESILKQSFLDYELIIVDDGSKDGTVDICKEYMLKDSRISLYEEEHRGRSAALNFALKRVKGKFVTFVDADDTVDKNHLKYLEEAMKEKKVDMACIGYRELEDGKMVFAVKYENESSDKYLSVLKNYNGFIWAKMFSQKIIKDNRLSFDESLSMCEDMLFVFNYLKFIKNVSCIDKITYSVYRHSDSLSRKINQSWFGILSVYGSILADSSLISGEISDIIWYRYLIACYEAKMRARMMGEDFNKICKKYNVDIDRLKVKYAEIGESLYISKKEKFRLFMFARFNFLCQLFKFRKIIYA